MTSAINPTIINDAYPVAGQDNSTKGFRDNFRSIKDNFEEARTEITELQNTSAIKGAGIVNNFAGGKILAAEIQELLAAAVNLGPVSDSVPIDYRVGHYQKISTSGNVVLSLENFPVRGFGFVRLELNISDAAHTVQLPTNITVNKKGVQGFDQATNTITFATAGVYIIDFNTANTSDVTGNQIGTVNEFNNQLRAFNNSSEDLAAGDSVDLSCTTSYFSTAAAETATLAAGVAGQIKVFAMVTDNGDMVITVANAGWKASGTGTITFDTIGAACTLQYVNSKWFCIGNNGGVFA